MIGEDEAAFLRAVDARLPNDECFGCYGCARHCTGNLGITRTEFEAIRDYLDGGGWLPVIRRPTEMVTPCEFQEPGGGRCIIYPVRPLICRLFGLVEWLPCPLERVQAPIADGAAIVAMYAQFERHSYREWLRMQQR